MRLSLTQEKVARLVGEGLGYDAIADRLSISAETVRVHTRRIAKKIDPSSARGRPYRVVAAYAWAHLSAATKSA